MKKEFNIIIIGVGGQGVLTLAGILARTALAQGYDVKASELHGLAMRFGSLEAHLRIGEKLGSALVSYGKADLIIAHEPLEALRAAGYANKDTLIIYDKKKQAPIISYIEKPPYPSLARIRATLKKYSKDVIAVDASEKTREKTGSTIMANTYILGRLVAEQVLPFPKTAFVKVLKRVVPKYAIKDNLEIFELGYESGK